MVGGCGFRLNSDACEMPDLSNHKVIEMLRSGWAFDITKTVHYFIEYEVGHAITLCGIKCPADQVINMTFRPSGDMYCSTCKIKHAEAFFGGQPS